jgi:two-component system, OmpR family, sensor histidine kinase KdpD
MRGRPAGGPAATRERLTGVVDLSSRSALTRYMLAVAPIVLATALAALFSAYISKASITLSYLVAILFISVSLGRGPALISCVLGVLALDYFFIEPLYSLTIYSTEDIVTLAFFLVVAVVASGLATRLRQQMLLARRHAETTANLYGFSRELAGIASLEALFAVVAREASRLLQSRIVILAAEGGHLVPRAAAPADAELDAAATAEAERIGLSGGAPAPAGDGWRLTALRTARDTVGVVAIQPEPAGTRLSEEQLRLSEALAELAGLAIERQLLAQEIDEIRLNREVARLGSVLLASVAHDLRTPIASALSALSALESDEARLAPAARGELVSIARRESERLSRFIGNLLEVTRLESGGLELRRELADPADVVAAAAARAREEFPGRAFTLDIAAELPLIAIDPVLIEQALFNLLHNAAKFAPPTAAVAIVAGADGDGGIIVGVLDEGPGIPPDQLERIFEKFHRVRSADGDPPLGSGLGLSISRGFVAAHGGNVTAANRTDRRGAVFTMTIPGRPPAPP